MYVLVSGLFCTDRGAFCGLYVLDSGTDKRYCPYMAEPWELREWARNRERLHLNGRLLREAADEIDSLRARCEKLDARLTATRLDLVACQAREWLRPPRRRRWWRRS